MSVVQNQTIYALSSGRAPSGVAIIRISGSLSAEIYQSVTGLDLIPRLARLTDFHDPISKEMIDRGLAIWFPGPNSFTGEDSVEFHCHGSVAVIDKFLATLSAVPNCRLAEPGEFSNRAFINGKMDLIEAEGLVDLIHANTEGQRRLALTQATGDISAHYIRWRKTIVEARALLEADLDFADEDDVPGSVVDLAMERVEVLCNEIANTLENARIGERLRLGVKIVIAGLPNAGKSSLLNYLAKRDVAIVSDIAGTTRDILEVHLNLDGIPVIISDTAGIRETSDEIEAEGVTRAQKQIEEADLVIFLFEPGSPAISDFTAFDVPLSIQVLNKIDLVENESDQQAIRSRFDHVISISQDRGLNELLDKMQEIVTGLTRTDDDLLVTRRRHLEGLEKGLFYLREALLTGKDLEMVAEDLRLASESLGRILGLVDVDDMLDVIFRDFCIGK